MMTLFPGQRNHAMTLLDLLVVLAVIGILAVMILPALMKAKAHDARIRCISNLKQIGLSYRIWEGDHNNFYPQAISRTNGGTMEFITGANAFRHFQIISNVLVTPHVLICPAESDATRITATNFSNLSNRNLSYFVGIVANESNANMILSGDRNLTNGTQVRNAILDLTTNTPAGWTRKIHNKIGNTLLADGSVQMVNISGLRAQVAFTGFAANRIQMPILGP